MLRMRDARVVAMVHSDLVGVRRVKGKGRGVFALCDIPEDTDIERVPVLIIPTRYFAEGYNNAALQKYCYVWDDRRVAIALGYGSLYNHSYEPNADYSQGEGELIYRAVRDIRKGEEITINYNGMPEDDDPVVFPVM